MPGPISDQYEGPRGDNPLVPTWMEDDGTKEYSLWLQSVTCPACGAPLFVEGKCPDCGYVEKEAGHA